MNVKFMNVCTQIISKNLNLKPRWSWRSRMSYNVDNLLCTEKQNWDKARRLWNQNKRASRTYCYPDHNLKTCYFVYCHLADILPRLFKFFFFFHFFIFYNLITTQRKKTEKGSSFSSFRKEKGKKMRTKTKKILTHFSSERFSLWTF